VIWTAKHAPIFGPQRRRHPSAPALALVAFAAALTLGAKSVSILPAAVDAAGLPGPHPGTGHPIIARPIVGTAAMSGPIFERLVDTTPADPSPVFDDRFIGTGAAGLAVAATVPAVPVDQVVRVGRGETLIQLLTDAGITAGEAHAAILALSEVFQPRSLKAGQDVHISLLPDGVDETGRLVSVSIQESVERDVNVSRGSDGSFVASAIDRPLVRSIEGRAGVIETSLYVAGEADGVPPPVMAEVIRAFSYDVDFQRDIQPGDGYEIVYEQYRDEEGLPAKEGGILFATLMLSGKPLVIYGFETGDGRHDYYNGKGESVRKALLRTPIDGARITSGFGVRRHPILGFSRMHKGIDFGARTGTPIYAAGDGVVQEAGRKGGYGNYVRIRHNGSYATAYAHMSRFAKGIRTGRRVDQGQVIGYVGSTGRSTGPHLHYEVMINGRQINPMSVKLPTGRKLDGKELERFQTERARIDGVRQGLYREPLLAGSAGACSIASC